MKNAEELIREVRDARAGAALAHGPREQLWELCKDVVAALAARYTRHAPDLREDFVSEGYLKFEQVLASYDPNRGVAFRGYLSGCVERHFLDRVRKKKDRHTDRPPERAVEEDPLIALGERERAASVQRALAGLLPGERGREKKLRAFRLRHFEGWTLEAIRDALDAPTTNAVAQWVHRVRKALRADLNRVGA